MKRAGFVIGGHYGVGYVTCRSTNNMGWTGPAAIKLEGGSFGLQIGAGETDVVFVVMNQSGMNDLLKDKFTIGAGASGMAGPVGRSVTAQTDAWMNAKILSYSRAHGVFAGATLKGSVVNQDEAANQEIYGHKVTNEEILTGKVRPPAVAQPLYSALNKYMPVKEKTAHR